MALLVFFVLASALLLATGNLHIGPVASELVDEHGHEEDAHVEDACAGCAEEEPAHDTDAEDHGADDDDDGHDHAAVTDIDGIFSINCEHNCPIVECDECRYEVGVVKINANR